MDFVDISNCRKFYRFVSKCFVIFTNLSQNDCAYKPSIRHLILYYLINVFLCLLYLKKQNIRRSTLEFGSHQNLSAFYRRKRLSRNIFFFIKGKMFSELNFSNPKKKKKKSK